MVKLTLNYFQTNKIKALKSIFHVYTKNVLYGIKDSSRYCLFWLRQGAQGVTLSVCQSQVSLRSVSGQSPVSLRSVSGQSQVSLRSVSGQS